MKPTECRAREAGFILRLKKMLLDWEHFHGHHVVTDMGLTPSLEQLDVGMTNLARDVRHYREQLGE